MRRSGRILLILGFVLAAFSALGLYWILANSKPPPPTVPTTSLVVAFQSVPERSEVASAQVGIVDWPETVPTPIGAYESADGVIGKLARAQISSGQPILENMLIDKSDLKELHSNASLLVEERNRAIAMPVKIDTNVAEAVQAGDRVDLVASFSVQQDSAQGQSSSELITTHRLLQDVLVLQVGPWPNSEAASSESSEGTGYSVVTLQVTLQDAEVVKFAQLNASDVSLALRRANDHTVEETEPVTLEYINRRFGYGFPIGGR